MKKFFLFAALAAFLLLFSACAPVNPELWTARFPELPSHWKENLGKVVWHLSYFRADGTRRTVPVRGDTAEIELPRGFATALLAEATFPERGIGRGVFKCAGAIFPFDAAGGEVRLSWQGGVEAFFYHELMKGRNEKCHPAQFNWPKFREKCDADDPWLIDWAAVAEKTARTGKFMMPRVPSAAKERVIQAEAGECWFGVSPFAEMHAADSDGVLRFNRYGELDFYFSPRGIVKINDTAQVFCAWERVRE